MCFHQQVSGLRAEVEALVQLRQGTEGAGLPPSVFSHWQCPWKSAFATLVESGGGKGLNSGAARLD